MKLYQYPNCSTCRKAIKFLDAAGQQYESINITEQPPSVAELKTMLEHYNSNIRKLFNTSGMQYRELNLKEALPNMTQEQAIELLSGNGKLVKRPFLLGANGGVVGFKEEVWQQLLTSVK